MVDALASRADEGRGMTAISLGWLSIKLSRGFPNGANYPGETWVLPAQHIGWEEGTRGTETSKYPEEKTLFP